MSFKIVCSFKHSSHYPLKTENVRTKKHFTLWNDNLFLFLEAAVFLSLLNDGVKGEFISAITSRPTVAQGVMPLRSQGNLRQNILDFTVKVDDHGRAENLLKFSTKKKVYTKRHRTTMWFESALDPCDYLALSCLRAYQTGKVCGKTIYYHYFTFKNYCMLDYANCRIKYEVWQAIHMGECLHLKLRSSGLPMSEKSSEIMRGNYAVEHDFGL